MDILFEVVYSSYKDRSIISEIIADFRCFDINEKVKEKIHNVIVDKMKTCHVYLVNYKVYDEDRYLVNTSTLYVKYMIWKSMTEEEFEMLKDDIANTEAQLYDTNYRHSLTGIKFQEECDKWIYPILDTYYNEEIKKMEDIEAVEKVFNKFI